MEISFEPQHTSPLLTLSYSPKPQVVFPQYQTLEVEKSLIKKATAAEELIFGFSGLKVYDEIQIFDVPIKYGGNQHIHTVRCGSSNNPSLVIIHGYGGSSITFYKLLKDLSQKFQVFCIDLLGMGLSSRPKFELHTTKECIEFFVESIEDWRKVLKLNEFILCGHSLGGYIATNYALRYKSIVKRLILMSPAGISGIDENFNFEEHIKNFGFMRRQFLKLASKIWNKKYTPNKLYKKTGFLGKYALKLYVTKRWSSTKQEAEPLQNYFDNILSMPESSEAAIHYLLGMPRARALLPMEQYIFDELKDLHIVFIYGDIDWMDKAGALKLFKTLPKVDYHMIQGAGHHANMDQPKEVCKIIMKYT